MSDYDLEDILEEDIVDTEVESYAAVIEEAVISPTYNQWSNEVSRNIELLTGYSESIETVGFEHWFYFWWKEGMSPEDAALYGISEDAELYHQYN